jgi:hypothetical protein
MFSLARALFSPDSAGDCSSLFGASVAMGFVTEELGLGVKCCEVALSSASARTWDSKIENAQKAHDTAQHFV